MKRDDIKVGKVYTNDNRRFRMIVGEGRRFTLYEGQLESDCVGFLAARVGRDGVEWMDDGARFIGHPRCTRRSFATWAKREATPEEAEAMKALFGLTHE